MGKQIKKVCKHEPGKQWEDGCCTPNPLVDTATSGKSNERVMEPAFEQSPTA